MVSKILEHRVVAWWCGHGRSGSVSGLCSKERVDIVDQKMMPSEPTTQYLVCPSCHYKG